MIDFKVREYPSNLYFIGLREVGTTHYVIPPNACQVMLDSKNKIDHIFIVLWWCQSAAELRQFALRVLYYIMLWQDREETQIQYIYRSRRKDLQTDYFELKQRLNILKFLEEHKTGATIMINTWMRRGHNRAF